VTALKVANERKSAVLASNAYHHRVDSLTAFVALLLITGSNFLNNAQWLDHGHRGHHHCF
jgi:divalent metal cation (Fe/Co/Zn/Cd) transporter